MRITCQERRGTGLRLPRCDAECTLCEGTGQLDKIFVKAGVPVLPDTEDAAQVRLLLDKERLGDWETDFTISVEKRVIAGDILTDRQRRKIKEILERHHD